MEENKKTSKEILPDSERANINTIIDSFEYAYQAKLFILKQLTAIKAAEREVEEKDNAINEKIKYIETLCTIIVSKDSEINELIREVKEKDAIIIHLNGMFTSAKGLIKEQEVEISSLKREIEEMKGIIKKYMLEFGNEILEAQWSEPNPEWIEEMFNKMYANAYNNNFNL